MLPAANQQACITMSKITELLGAKARGQDDGPKENLLNASQVMNAVATDVDKRKLTRRRTPPMSQPGGGVSGRGTTCPSVPQPQGSSRSNDFDAKIRALSDQVERLKEANLGLRTSRGSPGASATGAAGNRAADAGKNPKSPGKPSPSKHGQKGKGKGRG